MTRIAIALAVGIALAGGGRAGDGRSGSDRPKMPDTLVVSRSMPSDWVMPIAEGRVRNADGRTMTSL